MRMSGWSSDVCSSDLENGVAATMLETTGGARSGEDLRHLVNHARRMRTLMHYGPRRYDPVIIEALAMAGALDPQATRDDRLARAAEVARRLDQGDEDARWTVSATEQGGYHFERLWRGVTDHHIVEASFIVSAEARKLHGLRSEAHTSELPSLM